LRGPETDREQARERQRARHSRDRHHVVSPDVRRRREALIDLARPARVPIRKAIGGPSRDRAKGATQKLLRDRQLRRAKAARHDVTRYAANV
jgi:hypothetical protein